MAVKHDLLHSGRNAGQGHLKTGSSDKYLGPKEVIMGRGRGFIVRRNMIVCTSHLMY
jgi:hypothetical protein